MAKLTNTFSEGLDKDTVVTSYKNTHYYDARNFSVVVAEDLSSATLTNTKGVSTKLYTSLPRGESATSYRKIVGLGSINLTDSELIRSKIINIFRR